MRAASMTNSGDPYLLTRCSIDSRANGSWDGSSSRASRSGTLRILAALTEPTAMLTRAQFERVSILDSAGALQAIKDGGPTLIRGQLLHQDSCAARTVEGAQMIVKIMAIGVRLLAGVDPGHVSLRVERRAHRQHRDFFLPGDEFAGVPFQIVRRHDGQGSVGCVMQPPISGDPRYGSAHRQLANHLLQLRARNEPWPQQPGFIAETGDDGGFQSNRRFTAVQDDPDRRAQFVPHMLGLRRTQTPET